MKKLCLTIKDFFQLKGAVLYDAERIRPVTKVSIDSRNVSPGSLFIAIKGDKFDGHNFVREVIKNGASAVVIERKKYSQFRDLDIPVILVDKTIDALEIFDIRGLRVREMSNVGLSTVRLLTSNLPSGLYFVRCRMEGGGISTNRFVKN